MKCIQLEGPPARQSEARRARRAETWARAGSHPHEGGVAQLPRPRQRHDGALPAALHSAVRRLRRGGDGRRRHAREGGRPRRAVVLPGLAFRGRGAGARHLARRPDRRLPHRVYVPFREEGVSKAPDFLTDEQVATLPCAGLTAWRGLMEGGLKAGETVVVQGTGGVSIFALQFAKAAGATVIATSSSDEAGSRAGAGGRSPHQLQDDVGGWAIAANRPPHHRRPRRGPYRRGSAARAPSCSRFRRRASTATSRSSASSAASRRTSPSPRSSAAISTSGHQRRQPRGCSRTCAAPSPPTASRRWSIASLPFAEARAGLRADEGQGHFGKIALKIA